MIKRLIGFFQRCLFIVVFLLLLPSISPVQAASIEDPIMIYFFHSPTCTHCIQENAWLIELEENYDDLEVERLDYITHRDFLLEVAQVFGESSPLAPFTIIGGRYFEGFNDNIEGEILATLERYRQFEYVDVVAKMRLGQLITPDDLDMEFDDYFFLPIFGEVNVKEFSLVLTAGVIGLVDGFNPCAMWVLLFLIGLLIGSNDRKKMWWLGLTFLLSSALLYFLIMFTWMETISLLGAKQWIQILIGILALLAGSWNYYKFIKERKLETGCTVTSEGKQRKIMTKIRSLVQEKNWWIAIPGMVVLAIGVNVIELACSAGLPLLFSQILLVNGISGIQGLGYLLIYIFFFLFDDLLIFTIAMIAFKLTAISNRYTKYAHLIGSVIMIFVGLSLLFFPQLIMFGM